jgi:hypothetical protein
VIIHNFITFRTRFATSAAVGIDRLPVWPLANVRDNGFDTGLTGIPRPITAFPLTISCNAQASDGGAAFDWFLSQRKDAADVAEQYFTLTPFSATQSGTVTMALTAAGVEALGLALSTSVLSEDQLREAIIHCTLYVQRRSDQAIQLVELLKYTLSDFG